MKIITLENVDSTQTYLKSYIKTHGYTELTCVVAKEQTLGIGSRGNTWTGKKGNIFFSFVLHKNELPNDLPLQSASIYFSYLLKIVLKQMGSHVWIKWPNDFYMNDKKIGGTITTVIKDLIICGIGINIHEVSPEYGVLDINLDIEKLLNNFMKFIEKKLTWQEIFSEYMIEFEKSKRFKVTINGKKVTLKDAEFNDDGSIEINNEKVFSLR